MRNWVSNILEIVGTIAMVTAGFFLSFWLGVLMLGGGCALLGYALGDEQ